MANIHIDFFVRDCCFDLIVGALKYDGVAFFEIKDLIEVVNLAFDSSREFEGVATLTTENRVACWAHIRNDVDCVVASTTVDGVNACKRMYEVVAASTLDIV